MADGTGIEWCDATWQPVTGCSVVSPGCTNCYAMRLAGTRLREHPSRAGLTRQTQAGPVWTGEVRFNEQWLDQPLRWKRPRRIFVCAHGDLFAEGVPDEWIDRVFAVMALAPQHKFLVLTKRAKRMREYVAQPSRPGRISDQTIYQYGSTVSRQIVLRVWPLPHVWLGVSVEDQARADERIPELLATPAALRWVSAEPLLGPVDLPDGMCRDCGHINRKDGVACEGCGRATLATRLDWVVVGGESGPAARPMHAEWVRSLRDQCAAAGVPFFFKQWGEHWPIDQHSAGAHAGCARGLISAGGGNFCRVGKKAAGAVLDGREHREMPHA